MGILESYADSLNAMPFDKRDGAAVALGARLAQEIDAAEEVKVIADLSTRLLAVLAALGMTPIARLAITKGATPNVAPADAEFELDELRARRARPNGTENMDPPA